MGAGGLIWIHMGPSYRRPEFSEFEWTLLPGPYFRASKRMQMCNYLQNLEGEINTAHVNFLHRNLFDPADPAVPAEILPPDMESGDLT